MSRQIVIHVRSGLHSGARAIVASGQDIVLGRAADCGLVFADTSMADRHLSLRADGRDLVVTALDASIEIPRRGRVEPGFRTRLSRDTILDVGGVVLQAIVPSGLSQTVAMGIGIPAAIALAVAAGGVASKLPSIATATATLDRMDEPARDSIRTMMGPIEGLAAQPISHLNRPPDREAIPAHTTKSADPAPAAQPGLDRAALAAEIRSRLAETGFGNLTLAADRETFALTGRISDGHKAAFQGIQAWFDDAHPDLVLRTSGVAFVADQAAETKPPAIESVWDFGTPYIVVGGRRYHGGDTMPNGWMLERIEDERAIFSEGVRTYRVSLAPPNDDGTVPSDAQVAAR